MERNLPYNSSSKYTKKMSLSAMADSIDGSPFGPMLYLRMALPMLDGRKVLAGRILEGTGLTSEDINDPLLEPSNATIQRLFRNVAKHFGEGWFLRVPILWSSDIHSELGMTMRVAPDLCAAINVWTEFAHVRWPSIHLSQHEDESNIVISMDVKVPIIQESWQFTLCILALVFQTIARTTLPSGVQTIRYQLEGPPPSYVDRLVQHLDGAVSWGHRRSAIIVPKDVASQVSPVASPALFAVLLNQLRRLASVQGQAQAMISAKVSIILDSVTKGRLDASEVAQTIGISKRTLERRLRAEGTSFRQLSNESLKQRIESALRDPNLTAENMAETLGFHDASSLLRASRRLLGASLSQLRRKARAGQSST